MELESSKKAFEKTVAFTSERRKKREENFQKKKNKNSPISGDQALKQAESYRTMVKYKSLI